MALGALAPPLRAQCAAEGEGGEAARQTLQLMCNALLEALCCQRLGDDHWWVGHTHNFIKRDYKHRESRFSTR